MTRKTNRSVLFAAALGVAALGSLPASADSAAPKTPFGDPMFPQQTGEDIYKGVCQGCHMPDAKGAVGAGAYPALARNPKLEIAAYPIGVIVGGQKAMPSFGPYFTDEQIANVVTYIRTNFGNRYRGKVTPAM